MQANECVLESKGLTRYFGRKCAVGSVDLAVPRGSVFALLGRNGSGKTTTIRMLLGFLEPTRGSARVLGTDSQAIPAELRARVGYLAERHPVYGWMRVGESGRFQSRFYAGWKPRVFDSITQYFGLDPKARVASLSRGERAGLALALALAPEPELLVLDDPALGLDPVARRSFLEAVVHVTREAERTVFLSSHILADVERVADHVAVLDRGVLKAQCPVETLRARVRRFLLRFPGEPPEGPRLEGLLQSTRVEGGLRVTMVCADRDAPDPLRSLGAARVEEVPLSLEDALLAYLDARGEKGSFLGDVEPRLDKEDLP